MIPLFDLKAQYESIKHEIDEAVSYALSSGHYINGYEVESFEGAVCDYLDIEYAIGVASGTDALVIALRALDIGPGDEVIVPAFSFWSTASAVMLVGATPIFVDIHEWSWLINVFSIEEKITPKTKAIIPVHLYGNVANLNKLLDIARQYHIAIIEDAAQAFGATYDGAYAGTVGTIGCFSFFPTKPLGAAGDGGMLVTNDCDIAKRIKRLKSHGWDRKYDPQVLGYNSRLDAVQAAILRAKLPHVKKWIALRQDRHRWYSYLLGEYDFCSPVQYYSFMESACHLCVLDIRMRDQVASRLRERGIETGVYYPKPLPYCVPARRFVNDDDSFPIASYASATNLAIPCHEMLSLDDAKFILDNLVEVAKNAIHEK